MGRKLPYIAMSVNHFKREDEQIGNQTSCQVVKSFSKHISRVPTSKSISNRHSRINSMRMSCFNQNYMADNTSCRGLMSNTNGFNDSSYNLTNQRKTDNLFFDTRNINITNYKSKINNCNVKIINSNFSPKLDALAKYNNLTFEKIPRIRSNDREMAILSTSADSTSKTFYIQQLNVNAKSCKFTKGFNNIMFSDNSLNREPRLNGDLKNSILKKLQERIRGDTYDRNNKNMLTRKLEQIKVDPLYNTNLKAKMMQRNPDFPHIYHSHVRSIERAIQLEELRRQK